MRFSGARKMFLQGLKQICRRVALTFWAVHGLTFNLFHSPFHLLFFFSLVSEDFSSLLYVYHFSFSRYPSFISLFLNEFSLLSFVYHYCFRWSVFSTLIPQKQFHFLFFLKLFQEVES